MEDFNSWRAFHPLAPLAIEWYIIWKLYDFFLYLKCEKTLKWNVSPAKMSIHLTHPILSYPIYPHHNAAFHPGILAAGVIERVAGIKDV